MLYNAEILVIQARRLSLSSTLTKRGLEAMSHVVRRVRCNELVGWNTSPWGFAFGRTSGRVRPQVNSQIEREQVLPHPSHCAIVVPGGRISLPNARCRKLARLAAARRHGHAARRSCTGSLYGSVRPQERKKNISPRKILLPQFTGYFGFSIHARLRKAKTTYEV